MLANKRVKTPLPSSCLPDTWLYTLSFLGWKELLRTAAVARTWQASVPKVLARTQTLVVAEEGWLRPNPQFWRTMHRMAAGAKDVTVRHLAAFTSTDYVRALLVDCQRLRSLTLPSGIYRQYCATLQTALSSLQQLTVLGTTMHAAYLGQVCLPPTLRSFSIEQGGLTKTWGNALERQCRHLTTLRLEDDDDYDHPDRWSCPSTAACWPQLTHITFLVKRIGLVERLAHGLVRMFITQLTTLDVFVSYRPASLELKQNSAILRAQPKYVDAAYGSAVNGADHLLPLLLATRPFFDRHAVTNWLIDIDNHRDMLCAVDDICSAPQSKSKLEALTLTQSTSPLKHQWSPSVAAQVKQITLAAGVALTSKTQLDWAINLKHLAFTGAIFKLGHAFFNAIPDRLPTIRVHECEMHRQGNSGEWRVVVMMQRLH